MGLRPRSGPTRPSPGPIKSGLSPAKSGYERVNTVLTFASARFNCAACFAGFLAPCFAGFQSIWRSVEVAGVADVIPPGCEPGASANSATPVAPGSIPGRARLLPGETTLFRKGAGRRGPGDRNRSRVPLTPNATSGPESGPIAAPGLCHSSTCMMTFRSPSSERCWRRNGQMARFNHPR